MLNTSGNRYSSRKMGIVNSRTPAYESAYDFSAKTKQANRRVLGNESHPEYGQSGLVGQDLGFELEELRRQNEYLRQEMSSLSLERDDALREAQAKERESLDVKRFVNILRDQLKSSERQRDASRRDAEETHERASVLEEQLLLAKEHLRVKEGAIMEHQRANANLSATQAKTTALHQTRTLELQAAHDFLAQTDTCTEGDASQIIQELNSYIFEAAAAMSEVFQFESKRADLDRGQNKLENATDRVREILGPTMVQLLRESPRRANNAILIQVAFQGCMVIHCAWVIAAWHFDFDLSKEGKFLEDVYERLRQSETQAISGRWRALTRKYVQLVRHGGSDDVVRPSLITYLAKRMADVLLVANCNVDKDQQIHEMIINVYGDKLNVLTNLALRLNKAIGQNIILSDLEPVWTRPNVPFNPVWMDDMDDPDDTDNSQNGSRLKLDEPTIVRVLCTTSLGLRKQLKTAKGRQSKRSRSELKTMLILKPKVALESLLTTWEHPEGSQGSWSGTVPSVSAV